MGLAEQGRIAVVGLGGIFPEARTVREFWSNILAGKDCVKEIGEDREGYWKPAEYFHPDPSAPDKTYSKKAGFLPEITFDPMEFGIPPINMEAVSTAQLFALYTAGKTFDDAGILTRSNREKIGVVLGAGEAGNTAFYLAMRTEYPKWKQILDNAGLPDKISSAIVEKLKNLYPGWQENSMPGFLGNVAAGRITSHFDLSGVNYTVNAACATSLAAVKAAMSELNDGSCDAVLTGGIGVDNSILAFMSFTKTPVISRTGYSRPYDARADGMMLGDAVSMMVLKRLPDAERDGDKIYAVIRGIGSSSDGKSDSIYAPRADGQVKAMERAYEAAGCSPSTIRLMEGHGTGTGVGDLVEFRALSGVFGKTGTSKQSVALGSVKSQIGHGRVSAGACSLVKTILALYHKTLPPTINVEHPNPKFDIENSPFYLNTESRPWFRAKEGTPRRAAVSSFGFGGTNFHMVLEEYRKQEEKSHRLSHVPEMVLIHGDSREDLLDKCEALLNEFRSDLGRQHYKEYLFNARQMRIPVKRPRIGFVAKSHSQALELLDIALEKLKQGKEGQWEHPRGIFYRACAADLKGRVVALFPGQGSQYLNMGSQLVQNYPVIRQMVEEFDAALHGRKMEGISGIIYPPPCFSDRIRKRQERELVRTDNAQPAIGAVSAGLYALMRNAGFAPDFSIGHSFGELTALWAAGVIEKDDFITLAIERGRVMARCALSGEDAGAMLAVAETKEKVSALISRFRDLYMANYNTRDQFVIAGSKTAVSHLRKHLRAAGTRSALLPVSAAFHTPFVAPARESFAKVLNKTTFTQGRIPVWANCTGKIYPGAPDKIRHLLSEQITSPVFFRQAVESAHQKGGFLFVEIGPGKVLTGLTQQILQGKDHMAVALNPGYLADDEYEFRKSVVRLKVAGLDLDNIDPYRSWEPAENKDPGKKDPGKKLSVRLNGGLYLNPKTLEARNKSLNEKNPVSFDGYAEKKTRSGIPHKGETQTMREKDRPTAAAPKKDSGSSEWMTSLDVSSRMHLLYQTNQKKYLDLFSQICSCQNNLIEKFHDSPHLPLILANFEKTYQLLETNQPYYHTVHGEYLRTRPDADRFSPALGADIPARERKGAPLPDPPRPVLLASSPGGGLPDAIAGRIIESVSQMNDCPVDEIDMDADLEIDLGIDMMKAVRIMTALNAEFNLDAALLEEMIELRTLNEIVGFLRQKLGNIGEPETPAATPPSEASPAKDPAPGAVPASPEPSRETGRPLQGICLSSGPVRASDSPPSPAADSAPPASPAPTRVDSIDADELMAQIIGIVSEKTGYPEDMLEMDMDLRSDLGVDSIKIVQIIGAIQELYPDMEIMDPEELEGMEVRTLAEVADHVRQISAAFSPDKKKTVSEDS